MKRRNDLFVSFCVAIILHVALGVAMGALLTQRHGDLKPLFKKGKSSVKLTIVQTQPLQRPEIKVQPQELTPESIQIVREPQPKKEVVEIADSDLLVKGVEEFSADQTDLTRPRYPLGSKIRGEQGVVEIKVMVSSRGVVEAVEIIQSSGYSSLDKAAVKAAWQTTFVVNKDKDYAAGEVVLPKFRFKLED